MNLLLDTHALYWFMTEDARFPDQLRRELSSSAHVAWVSPVSAWELEIKRAAGKLQYEFDVTEEVTEVGFIPLTITFEHAATAGRLPDHHRDPFDRMLVAQARVEGLTLVTRDPQIRRYEVPTVWK